MKKLRFDKAVILDRDGTLIHDRPGHYLSRPQDMRLYSSAAQAVKLLSHAGFKLFIVTNQSGIARGYFSESMAMRINEKLARTLAKQGGRIQGVFFCPHGPDDNCPCRKPRPAMGLALIKQYRIAPRLSYVVGDKLSDMQFGKKLGMKTVLVKTGHGRSHIAKHPRIPADKTAAGILQAAKWILKNEISN